MATHPDVEFHVETMSGETKVFDTFDAAAGLAVAMAASDGRPHNIDVCIWSEAGALAYGGDDAVETYQEDPEASVFERIRVWGVESLGRIA